MDIVDFNFLIKNDVMSCTVNSTSYVKQVRQPKLFAYLVTMVSNILECAAGVPKFSIGFGIGYFFCGAPGDACIKLAKRFNLLVRLQAGKEKLPL